MRKSNILLALGAILLSLSFSACAVVNKEVDHGNGFYSYKGTEALNLFQDRVLESQTRNCNQNPCSSTEDSDPISEFVNTHNQEIEVTPVSKEVVLPDGVTTHQWVETKKTTVLDGMFTSVTVPKRFSLWCIQDQCVIENAVSDSIEVNTPRTLFAIVGAAVTVKILFLSGGGGNSVVTTKTVVGGGGGPPPGIGI